MSATSRRVVFVPRSTAATRTVLTVVESRRREKERLEAVGEPRAVALGRPPARRDEQGRELRARERPDRVRRGLHVGGQVGRSPRAARRTCGGSASWRRASARAARPAPALPWPRRRSRPTVARPGRAAGAGRPSAVGSSRVGRALRRRRAGLPARESVSRRHCSDFSGGAGGPVEPMSRPAPALRRPAGTRASAAACGAPRGSPAAGCPASPARS
jgi:hypothetical protein